MVPVVFNQCFGWLHGASGNTGVVMCGPYGHEALLAHRGWRGIADHLASTGIPVLRFDYRGTGDSDASEGDGDRFDAWLESIHDAVRFLRENTSAQRVILCGIRLGALLAATAAATPTSDNSAIDGVALLAPVTSGRDYLRELKLMQRQWRNSAAAHIPAEENVTGYVEALGFRLFPQTIARLESVTLLSLPAPQVPRVLIMDSLNVLGVRRICEYYRASGIDVALLDFPDYPRLIAESNYARPPLLTHAALASWVATFDNPVGQGVGPSIDEAARASAPAALSATLTGDGFIETAHRFADGRLFGIYCRPSQRTDTTLEAHGIEADAVAIVPLMPEVGRSLPGRPPEQAPSLRASIIAQGGDVSRHGVLFANTAASNHIGEARMWVEQARHLARQGVASLRMDVGTLGDSQAPAVTLSDADQHADQSVKDVSSGIDFLFDHGHTVLNAVGICSGAYLVMKAAVGNPRLKSALLVNQRIYALTAELMDRQGTEAVVASNAAYLRSIRSLEKWRRLFAGKIPFATITKRLVMRRGTQWRRAATYVFDALAGRDSDRTSVRRDFKGLEKRGVPLRVVYGELDVGLEESDLFFGRDLRWLRKLRNVKASIERSLDHGLFLYPARELLQRWIEEQVLEQATPRTGKLRNAGYRKTPLDESRASESVSGLKDK